MATESIKLPGPLIQKVKEAASQEKITPEELVRDAVEVRLRRGEWRKAWSSDTKMPASAV